MYSAEFLEANEEADGNGAEVRFISIGLIPCAGLNVDSKRFPDLALPPETVGRNEPEVALK